MFETLLADIRYAFRWLAKSPAFTLLAVASFAIGIGFNTALFTLVDMIAAAIALRIEREPMWHLIAVPLQRFFYRQLMYAAIIKSVATAAQGLRTGWGKLDRMATVSIPVAGAGSSRE